VIAVVGKEIAELWPLALVAAAFGLVCLGWWRHNKGQQEIGRRDAEAQTGKEKDEARKRADRARRDGDSPADLLPRGKRRRAAAGGRRKPRTR